MGEVVAIPRPRWVISDTHLGHAQILSYCPWRQTWASSVEQHDRTIIEAWRATVGIIDWVLHLGDVALGDLSRLPELRKQLPGRVIVVKGNHDPAAARLRDAGFDLVVSAARVAIDGKQWICRHNPAAFSPREAKAAVRLLHGHAHGNGYHPSMHPAVRAKVRDCSLDALRWTAPVRWEDVA